MNVEDDEAGRLAGFRARFGRGYDSGKDTTANGDPQRPAPDEATTRPSSGKGVELEDDGFGEEEDANLLDLISSYGQAEDARGRKKAVTLFAREIYRHGQHKPRRVSFPCPCASSLELEPEQQGQLKTLL
ncbi:hypothetical protein GJ744_009902 [Endocarpon pusillum]|uniref:Uncharacterized protein n=1 Tax=Endocarpon pusillum TaxID=364733 RepID=A0A8H7AF91_9EURO|nr:hypothetical protein GJ744_009902 [Endocarpon pusillum]